MRLIRILISTTLAITFVLLCFLATIEIIAFNDELYIYEVNKCNIVIDDLDTDDTINLMEDIQRYLLDKRSDLDISIDGKEMFTEREKIHMVDVKEIFSNGIKVRNISLTLFSIALFAAVLLRYYCKQRFFPTIVSICKWLSVGILVVASIIGTLLLIDFNKYFTIFHELSFSNDYWLLDPDTTLIQMVPEQFFNDMALYMVGSIIVELLIFVIFGFIYKRRRSRWR